MKPRKNDFDLDKIAQNAVLEFGFTPFFNQAAEAQVGRLKAPRYNKKDGIKDLRELEWSSIDNVDSKDLDQVEFCERRPQNKILVRVAIADVDYFVQKGDAIDRHASHNATSLYTGLVNYPMLPEQLSYDFSSLIPNEDRIAIVIEYTVHKDGSVSYGDVYRAWVRNQHKLIYEEVGAWLLRPQAKPEWLKGNLKDQLLLQYEAAKRLRQWRQKEGMLEFDTLEAKLVIEDGKIVNMVARQTDEASKIIEHFMVAANQAMVNFLSRHHLPTIQRIVRNPERWGRIVEIAAEYGHELPHDPDNLSLRKFLMDRYAKSPQTFADLSLSIIKLIGRGEYEMVSPGKQSKGHFGLSVGHYTHSTAPNRRYVDLVIQRLVKAVLAKKPSPYDKRDLVELAAWCSERDTSSKKMERFVRKVAAALMLLPRVGDEFEGVITGASFKGVYVRLLSPPAEGRIVRGEQGLDVGQKVMVRLINADPIKGYLDFQHLARVR